MKALAGSSWGQDPETLIITYKAIIRTVLEYAAPIWSPIISETSWKKLQVVQNHALRIITGCLTKSSETHLHRETKVLPIKPHSTMITKQYLASCFSSTHPGNKHLALPAPPRNLKPSMQIHETLVKEKFDSGLNRKYAIKEIHTHSHPRPGQLSTQQSPELCPP